MEFSGTQRMAAPIEKVWMYLADVRKVAACIPGIQDIEEREPGRWQARIAVGVGLVKAKFGLEMTRPEMHSPERMTIVVRGKAPGNTAELTGHFLLNSLNERETDMAWRGTIVLGGALALVGTRILENTGDKMIADYFACLNAGLQAEIAAESASSSN